MALHIMPAGEIHQTNPKCPCKPATVRYRRRSALKHRANPVPAAPRTEVAHPYVVQYPQARLDEARLFALAARQGRGL